MGANADPSGSLGGPHRQPSPAALALQHGVAASTAAALRHDPGIEMRWSSEEQALLDKGLASYVLDAAIVRYAKIALSLPNKTVRDVALRCRWMAKKDTNKKRKEELAKKSKEKKAPQKLPSSSDRNFNLKYQRKPVINERVGDSSTKGPAHLARPNVPPYSLPALPMEDDDVSYKAIGGPTGELLERNSHMLNQIYANISNMQVQDNLSLLREARDNILTVQRELSNVPEMMSQMPPLPVKLNENLADSMLPKPPHPRT